MIYLKSILVGFVTALAASVIWILAVFVLPIWLPFLLSRITGDGGVGAASIGSGLILGVALVGFAFGFFWKFRRLSIPPPRQRR